MQNGSSVDSKVKQGNFGGLEFWKEQDYQITTQLTTELYRTASRQNLRLHYIFDFDCKS